MQDEFEFGFDVFLLSKARDDSRIFLFDDAIPIDFVVVFERLIGESLEICQFEQFAEFLLEGDLFIGSDSRPFVAHASDGVVVVIDEVGDIGAEFVVAFFRRHHGVES